MNSTANQEYTGTTDAVVLSVIAPCFNEEGNIDQLDTVRNGGVIPEPGTFSLLGIGLVGLIVFRRRAARDRARPG